VPKPYIELKKIKIKTIFLGEKKTNNKLACPFQNYKEILTKKESTYFRKRQNIRILTIF
jgi:hypothetical protein